MFKVLLLKWFISWAKLFDALIGIITLGLIMPNLTIVVARLFVKHKYIYIAKQMKNKKRESNNYE